MPRVRRNPDTLEGLKSKYASEDVAFLAVSVDDAAMEAPLPEMGWQHLRDYVSEQHPSFGVPVADRKT